MSTNTIFLSTEKMTGHPVVASCVPGFSNLATGLSAASVLRPVAPVSLTDSPVRERGGRPTQAPETVAKAAASAYGFAAAGADIRKQTTHHHTMWAFRGLKPWSHPA